MLLAQKSTIFELPKMEKKKCVKDACLTISSTNNSKERVRRVKDVLELMHINMRDLMNTLSHG